MVDYLSAMYISIILIIGLLITIKTAKKNKTPIVYIIFVEHFILSFIYYVYTRTNVADANRYYNSAQNNDFFLNSFDVGTEFIIFIATIPVKYLHFSLITTHMLFALFGFIGFLYLLKMLEKIKISLFGMSPLVLVLLLPGFHFWTCAFGKDSLFFMGLMMLVYSMKNINTSKIKLVFSFLLIGLIRPHMLMIIIMAITAAFLVRNPRKFSMVHVLTIFVMVGFTIVTLPILLNFIGVEEISTQSIEGKIEKYNNEGVGGNMDSSNIDVTNYNLPMKLFAYLFRPLFFSARSVFQLFLSMENLFLLLLVIKYFYKLPVNIFKWYKKMTDVDKILFMYVILSSIILSLNMYNLGLASRQKYMIFPVVFILFFSKNYKSVIQDRPSC